MKLRKVRRQEVLTWFALSLILVLDVLINVFSPASHLVTFSMPEGRTRLESRNPAIVYLAAKPELKGCKAVSGFHWPHRL